MNNFTFPGSSLSSSRRTRTFQFPPVRVDICVHIYLKVCFQFVPGMGTTKVPTSAGMVAFPLVGTGMLANHRKGIFDNVQGNIYTLHLSNQIKVGFLFFFFFNIFQH